MGKKLNISRPLGAPEMLEPRERAAVRWRAFAYGAAVALLAGAVLIELVSLLAATVYGVHFGTLSGVDSPSWRWSMALMRFMGFGGLGMAVLMGVFGICGRLVLRKSFEEGALPKARQLVALAAETSVPHSALESNEQAQAWARGVVLPAFYASKLADEGGPANMAASFATIEAGAGIMAQEMKSAQMVAQVFGVRLVPGWVLALACQLLPVLVAVVLGVGCCVLGAGERADAIAAREAAGEALLAGFGDLSGSGQVSHAESENLCSASYSLPVACDAFAQGSDGVQYPESFTASVTMSLDTSGKVDDCYYTFRWRVEDAPSGVDIVLVPPSAEQVDAALGQLQRRRGNLHRKLLPRRERTRAQQQHDFSLRVLVGMPGASSGWVSCAAR